MEIAAGVAPAEVLLAPVVVDTFLAGGKKQRDLFAASSDQLGGFGVAGITALFPTIIGAISLAGPAILALLNSPAVKDGVGVLQTLLKLREKNNSPSPAAQAPHHATVVAAAAALTDELQKLGVDADKRDAIAYRTLIVLLSQPEPAERLVTALANAKD